MADFLNSLKTAPLLADGAMGSYLFERTGRLSEKTHIYEMLNMEEPELIREIHTAYLRAGAQCLTTNSFGANRSFLAPLGESKNLIKINQAAVSLAKAASSTFRELQKLSEPVFVLGSIGPPSSQSPQTADLGEIYLDQIGSLVEGGVDALLLETFSSLELLHSVIELIRREFPVCPPLIAEMTFQRSAGAAEWSQSPERIVRSLADLGVDVVGVNCCPPWEATAFLESVKDLDIVRDQQVQLAAMPNAGGFQRIGNRFMTHVNPEFMGRLARTFAAYGVHLIGGCCEVHPQHIKEMRNFLHSHLAGERRAGVVQTEVRVSAGREEKKNNGPFTEKLLNGAFVVSVELLPSRGTSPDVLDRKINFVKDLTQSGLADAIDITDGSRGIPLIPPADFITVIRERLGWTTETEDGLEFIPHFTCRDLNVMGLQSRLIGLHVQRIHNVLFITGDPPKMSPTYPRSTAVFDLDSVALLHYTHAYLNAGLDFGGRPLGRNCDPRTHFTIGTGFEPEGLDQTKELNRLRTKIESGADYVMTQPTFRYEALEILDEIRGEIPILVGVMILTDLDHALRLAEVPGVVIPDKILNQLATYSDPDDQARLGIEIAAQQVAQIKREGWPGLYLMSPASLQPIIPVLEEGLS